MSVTFDRIQEFAEKMKNDEHQIVGPMAVGDRQWQGDLAITFLGTELPKGLVQYVPNTTQLVEGNTQGSRHCLASMFGVTFYRFTQSNECTGPVLVAETEFQVTHPEHGDLTFQPGIYGVTYQRSYANELRRQRD